MVRNTFRIVLMAFVILTTSVLVWAGGTKEKATNPTAGTSVSKQFKVALVPKLLGIPYFNRAEEGAKKAASNLGVQLIYTGPTTIDPAAQVSSIESLIARGVNVIAVAPDDPASVTPVLMRAHQAGILIMDWDTPAQKSVVDYSIHQINDKQYAETIWDTLVKYMGPSGDYGIMTGGLTAENLNTWIKYGEEYAKTKYPGLHVVADPVPCNENQQTAFRKGLDFLKAYPQLKGVIGISSPATPGLAQAIEQLGLAGKIANVGTTLPSQIKPFLKDKAADAAILWDPAKLAYLTVYIANQVLNGKKPVDGETVPNVGKITLEPDGKTVVMGKPQVFDAANIAQYPF